MPTERDELIEAREVIKRQIEILENPIRPIDTYPVGIARLRATLAEIEKRLAELNEDQA